MKKLLQEKQTAIQMCTPGPAPCAGGPIELVPHDSIGDHFMVIPRDANKVEHTAHPNQLVLWNLYSKIHG
jgi:hypothetical protein